MRDSVPSPAVLKSDQVMFSGIVIGMGRVLTIRPSGGDRRVQVGEHTLKQEDVFPGASICVSGVCLTVEQVEEGCFWSTVSQLSWSVIVPYQVAQLVNLEPAVRVSQHVVHGLVSGHIDGVAVLYRRSEPSGTGCVRLSFSVADELQTLIAHSGSVVIHGVSVAVDAVDGCTFAVQVAADILQKTNLGPLSVGQNVNIEIALITRYRMRYHAVLAANQWAVG